MQGTTVAGDMNQALVNMLSKNVVENNQRITVNKYNSSIKGVIDGWYEGNLYNLSNFLNHDAVFCNDMSIRSLGSFSPTGSTTGDYQLKFKHYITTISLGCDNVTDRFSKNNTDIAELTYPIGLLTASERTMMYHGYVRVGFSWWLGSSRGYDNYRSRTMIVRSDGSADYASEYTPESVRPVIVLKPGIAISGGNGTYNSPYIVDTTSS